MSAVGEIGKLRPEAEMVLEGDKKQAEAVGIVMALFAGALVGLAQVVEAASGTRDTSSASWQALRIFLYGSIMLSLSGAFLSLLTIKMCSDLPLAFYQRQITPPPPTTKEERRRLNILLNAGMSHYYTWLDGASILVLILTCVCTFASLTFWVLLNTPDSTTSRLTIIIFGPVAIVVVGAFIITSHGERWR